MALQKVLGVLLITALFGTFPALAQNEILVLEGGTLIDGNGGAPINDAVVVMNRSRIQAVGTRGQLTYPDNALVIDVSGKTILPGLIDSHVHLREWMPQMFLRYGVTTIADTNNHHAWIVTQREALNSGKIKGPRLYIAGQGMGGPNGNLGPTNRTLRNEEETRAFVREMVLLGVDMLKTQADLTREEVSAIVEEAAAAGIPVVGHSRNAREATLLGLKFMEHTDPLVTAILEEMGPETLRSAAEGNTNPEDLMDTRLYDSLIALMVAEGVFVNNTMVARMRGASPREAGWIEVAEDLIDDAELAFVPEDVREGWTQPSRRNLTEVGFRNFQEFMRKYVEAGGRVLAGTDAGYIPGLSLHYEMQMIADSGVSPMNVILSATRWAAESFGKEAILGTVEAGKLADITVIDGDPLADITNTQNVHLVIKNGKIVDTTYATGFVNPIPRPVGVDPVLSGLAPKVAHAGDADVVLRIEGLGFSPDAVVRFDTTDLETEFVSSSELSASIGPESLQSPGSFAITVVNPGSGGGSSDTIHFVIGLN